MGEGFRPCAGRPTRPKLRPCFARRPRLRAPHVNDREDTMLHRAPLGALAAGLLMLSGTALAQQPPAPAAGGAAPAAGAAAPAAPPAPGSALYGRPESESAARLAPLAPPPIPTPAPQQPVAKL